MRFKRLFEPLYLDQLKLPNRVGMPPITTNYAQDGFVSDRMIDFYASVARGGAGLIIVEDCIIDSTNGRHTCNDTFICDDKYIPGLRRLAQTIKDKGAVAAVQLSHAGRGVGRLRDGQTLLAEGAVPVAPSPFAPRATGYILPKELTVEEIQEIINRFATAALRAQEAGFELISFHCTHGYLIEQFLSPISNRRSDGYGGDPERRFRFISEIIHRAREKVGNDFPIMCRISGAELTEGGLTVEDCQQNAKRLETAGVNCISVSVTGRIISGSGVIASSAAMRSQHGTIVHLAASIKRAVSIPVMTADRIITPDLAEKILEEGKADIIGIGRGLVADPEWPFKAREGRLEDIRYCISCESCLPMGAPKELPLACAINPVAGREEEFKITRASEAKKVLIAGGGPAGLEAGRVAALRGHLVYLYEKDKVGGQINLASRLPGKNEMELFINFEREQLSKLGVKIKNRELTSEIVLEEKPDVLIVATGASPVLPQIPGITNNNVISYWQVLGGAAVNDKVVVIGGSQLGAETAEYLASKGCEVTIVEESDRVAWDIAHLPLTYGSLLASLEQLEVKVLSGATVKRIEETGVVVKQTNRVMTVPADMVVVAKRPKSNRALADQLDRLDIPFYLVGDCAGVGRLSKAVKEGFRVALNI